MKPKEKAKELFDKMCQTIGSDCEDDSYCDRKECKWKGITFCVVSQNEAKQCALICAEEVIREVPMYTPRWKYWNDVIIEIHNL